jgi:Phage integrase, N-terminal SAM-like domain
VSRSPEETPYCRKQCTDRGNITNHRLGVCRLRIEQPRAPGSGNNYCDRPYSMPGPPDRLGPQHIREYQAQLFTLHKLTRGSVTNHLCALRFFYIQTLKKPWSIADTPYPKKRYRLAPSQDADGLSTPPTGSDVFRRLTGVGGQP